MKAIHMVNEYKIFSVFYAILKPFMKQKIEKRVRQRIMAKSTICVKSRIFIVMEGRKSCCFSSSYRTATSPHYSWWRTPGDGHRGYQFNHQIFSLTHGSCTSCFDRVYIVLIGIVGYNCTGWTRTSTCLFESNVFEADIPEVLYEQTLQRGVGFIIFNPIKP